jgi:1,4-alpha-glucan branching enzyme
MIKRNFYLLLIGVLLAGVTACSKKPDVGPHTGNVTGTTVTGGVDVPAGANDGVTFLNGGKSVIFNLYAPNKTSVSVIGDFNSWSADAKSKMTNSKDGTRWWVQIDNLDPNVEYAYQYLIDGTLKVADPYTEKVLDPDNDKYIPTSVYPGLKAYPTGQSGIVSTFYANQPAYTWKATGFTRPDPKNLVIYEMHVRDFVATHSYKTITDTLNYLSNLGINAIELMPVSEFEGNDSWGYNPNFYFAPDKYYGTKNDLKAFIDACHARGIAVIQDIVLNHSFGSSPMVQMYFNGNAPAANSPWFNVTPTHPYNVGYQFNHESQATKYFTKNVIKFWDQEYKIDGYRFDLAKGFTQVNTGNDVGAWGNYDASRVAIWKDYNNYMKSIDPSMYVILEFFGGDQEESELANQGMIMWNNLNYNATQATMGYTTDWFFSRLFYDQHHFTAPYNLVGYFESHDEERSMFKNEQFGNSNATYSTKDISTGLKREEAAAVFLFSAPGPKMLWQFEELGYDISIDQNGRLGDKPIHWDYTADAGRHHLYSVYAKMIKMKTKNAVFATTNFTADVSNAIKTVNLNGTDGTNVVILGNFDIVSQTGNINFPATGTWYDNIDGTSITVGSLPYSKILAPGEYHVYSNTLLHQ